MVRDRYQLHRPCPDTLIVNLKNKFAILSGNLRSGTAYLTLYAGIALLLTGAMNLDAPLPGFTGGFEEPTCVYCHFEAPVNAPEGSLTIVGVPSVYMPDSSYGIAVTLTHPELERGGFQLAVRFAEGKRIGLQAGDLTAVDGRIAVDTEKDVQYARHTVSGTVPSSPDTSRWTIVWRSPSMADTPVILHLTGNAANDDNSEFGDFIYQTSLVSKSKN
jgi:hypothetical protein